MREMGLYAIYPKPRLSKGGREGDINGLNFLCFTKKEFCHEKANIVIAICNCRVTGFCQCIVSIMWALCHIIYAEQIIQ